MTLETERLILRPIRNVFNGNECCRNLSEKRTAISRKPEEIISRELANLQDNNVMTPDLVFKSPYFLDFAEGEEYTDMEKLVNIMNEMAEVLSIVKRVNTPCT